MKSVRGTRDILPEEARVRDYVLGIIQKTYESWGFTRIQTPVLEDINLLLGSDGGENLKMIFRILKRGDKLDLTQENLKSSDLVDLGLRYDLTLPLSRFFASNRNELEFPFKAIQIGEVFRAERPQKGRFRAFTQCDIDILGDESLYAEVQLIETTCQTLKNLGLSNFKVRINDRRILQDLIIKSGFNEENVSSVCITLDKLDKIGFPGVVKELEANGYPSEAVNQLVENIDQINKNGFEEMKKIGISDSAIDAMTFLMTSIENVEFDVSLVRGMGYYTSSIFEVSYGDLGYSVAGGGRYDKMIGKIIGEDVPAVGFSIGFERIVGLLMEENFVIPNQGQKIALLFDENDDLKNVVNKAKQFISNGDTISIIKKKKKMGKQIEKLKAAGYTVENE